MVPEDLNAWTPWELENQGLEKLEPRGFGDSETWGPGDIEIWVLYDLVSLQLVDLEIRGLRNLENWDQCRLAVKIGKYRFH